MQLLCILTGHMGQFVVWVDCDHCGVEVARQVALCPNCGPTYEYACSICRKEP